MSKKIGVTVKKDRDFSEWYLQVVQKAELADYAAVKGFTALRPYGYALWEKIQRTFDAWIRRRGHANAYFPALIPESLLRKEAEHFEGFTPEVFWVTHAGDERLGERLAVRPTSETIIYESYAKWVRSWRDLPLLINVWNSVLRGEIKSTKPFLRTSEFLWQEGHTVHATKGDADREVMDILLLYRRLMEEHLAIPVLVGRKTEREKFVGALYTTTLESIMPDGRALQMGTSHNLGQNFSKPFGIRFLGKDEKEHYAWQTSWGISWRLIGALIMTHGDDRGLVLPPRVAPIQAALVPIYYSEGDREAVVSKLRRTAARLKRRRVSCVLDDRDQYTPGWKFNEWEMKGVPLRIEVGPKDVEQGQTTLVRRDTSRRFAVSDRELESRVKSTLHDIQRNLYQRALAFLREHTTPVSNMKDFKETLDRKGGFLKTVWCGERECEERVKEETGADIRLIPFDERAEGCCVHCGSNGKTVTYFASAY